MTEEYFEVAHPHTARAQNNKGRKRFMLYTCVKLLDKLEFISIWGRQLNSVRAVNQMDYFFLSCDLRVRHLFHFGLTFLALFPLLMTTE